MIRQEQAGIAESSATALSLCVPAARRRRGRPTSEEAEELRDSILNAALQSFMTHGFEASSLEGIARSAGVARVTLYRHFESKEQMFVQVTRRSQLRVRRRLEQPIDMAQPLEEILRYVIGTLYDGFTQSDYVATFRLVAGESKRFPKLGRAMLTDMKHLVEPVTACLTELKNSGRIDLQSPLQSAIQIAGLASGAGRYLMVPASKHPVSRNHWVDSLTELFFKAWRTS